MMNYIAEAFPPGEFIKEELAARYWSQVELAEIIGRDPKVIHDLITGKRPIVPELAQLLGDALGTSAMYWMNLESSYRLWRSGAQRDDTTVRRARLYEIAPIKDMCKRHWIEPSADVAILENQVKALFGISNFAEPLCFSHVPRKSSSGISNSQIAWMCRARQIAKSLPANSFSAQSLDKALLLLKQILPDVTAIGRIPSILADAGIRFLIVEHLPHTRIDGVTFWLDDNSPVVALSLRYDRVDAWWYTLAHELAHGANRDGVDDAAVLDIDISGEQAMIKKNTIEIEADKFASNFLVNEKELTNFTKSAGSHYSARKINEFASKVRVYPGIVVGQLQHHHVIPWSSHRSMLVKIRDMVVSSAVTDGWGKLPKVK